MVYISKEMIKTFVDFQKSFDELKARCLDLEKTINAKTGNKPLDVKRLPSPYRNSNISNYESSFSSSWTKPTGMNLVNRVVVEANNDLEEGWAKYLQAHEENIPALENNKHAVETIRKTMSNAGIESSYNTWEYKTSRSKDTTMVKHQASFESDLSRVFTLTDNFDETIFEKQLKRIEEYKASGEELAKAFEDAKKAEEEKKTRAKFLATLLVKYELEYDKDWEDLLDVVLNKDKYLCLAHGMLMNRGDWSDGYGYAESGLDGFTIESKQDKEIAKDVQENIDDWENDGRCFRDTTWNYDRIFELVDKELMKDYNIIQKYYNFHN